MFLWYSVKFPGAEKDISLISSWNLDLCWPSNLGKHSYWSAQNDGPIGAFLQIILDIDTKRWRWLQMVRMADEQALDPISDVLDSTKKHWIGKPQQMPSKTMTRTWRFLQKAGKVHLFVISIKFGAKLLLVPRVWGNVPIGPSNLCQPIGVFPQIWWST